MRVLVVDDSALARHVAVTHLGEDGYTLEQAASGEEALAVCAAWAPDVVLLDVEMPGIGGYETLRRITADPELCDIPVLFLTGRTNVADLETGLRLGAHDYLRKPFEAVELRARVAAAARTRRLQVALRERNAELERIATLDGLTGLYNRRFLEDQARRAASRLRRHGGTMGVAIVDIDRFKHVNDTHGHAAGDAVLVTVAARLATGLRQEDVLGRWGGEEFVVLAADTDAIGTAHVAERLRAAVDAGPVEADGGAALAVTVSVGWAAAQGGAELDVLVRTADRALYLAKAAGRNAVRGTDLSSA